MFQIKEQNRNPEEEPSVVETGKLFKKEFRVIIVKTIKEFGRRMDAQCEK